MSDRLDAFISAARPRIEAALAGAIEGIEGEAGAAARYAVEAGGKRVRPLLALAAWGATSGEEGPPPDAVVRVAAAVELVHTYSLLHDDLPAMDDDPLRRGRPTAHRVFGVPAATAAGGALQQAAFLELGRAARAEPALAHALPAMVRRLARAAGAEGMVGGQWLDLEAEGADVDAHGLEAIHRGKTAALISAACAIGALAARADGDLVDALAEYGLELGLAFQIVDDLLDVEGDPAATGKRAGADAERAKATYPAVHGVDGARARAEAAAEAARDALDDLPSGEGARVLDDFVGYVLARIH